MRWSRARDLLAVMLVAAAAPASAQFDFGVGVVSAPATADAGATITLSVIESSAAGAPSPYAYPYVVFYIANNPGMVGKEEVCPVHRQLETGTSQSVGCGGQLRQNLVSGRYYLTAVIVAGNYTDTNSLNDTSPSPTPIDVSYHPPDLSIAQVTAPASAVPGAEITVTAVESFAPGSSWAYLGPYVTFYLARDPGLTTRYYLCGVSPSLMSGMSRSVSCTGTVPYGLSPGSYYVGAVIQTGGYPTDGNPQNDIASVGPITLGPDLVAAELSVADVSAAGAWVTVADTVTNRGAAAGSFVVGYYLSTDATVTRGDVLLGSRAVPGLAAGAASGATTQLQLPAGVAGRFYLAAVADSALQVAEADETNNTSPIVAIDVVSDAAPPQITVTGVADGEITNAVPLSACYIATDDFLTSDEGTLDGIPFRGCATAVSEGIHSLTVTASDFAGHVTTFQASFTIDRSSPDLDVAWPTVGAVVGSLVNVSAAVSDLWGVAAVEANGAPLGLAQDGLYHGAIAMRPSAPRVVVRARDLAGNTRSVVVPIVLDTVCRAPPDERLNRHQIT
jgi:hypothetical protein